MGIAVHRLVGGKIFWMDVSTSSYRHDYADAPRERIKFHRLKEFWQARPQRFQMSQSDTMIPLPANTKFLIQGEPDLPSI